MADNCFDFDTWLSDKLKQLSLDEEVYLDYLKGVLEEDESQEEAREALCDILSGVLEDNVEAAAGEIVEAWGKRSATQDTTVENQLIENDDKIKVLMEEKALHEQKKFASKRNKNVDHELKEQLLAQYAEISDEDEGDVSSDDDKPPTSFVNVNAQAVADKQQHEREKAKKEHDEKKQRDKLNLQKDKAKKEERQDKEKNRTQKGERKAR